MWYFTTTFDFTVPDLHNPLPLTSLGFSTFSVHSDSRRLGVWSVVCSQTNTRGTDSTLLQRLIVRGLRIICFLFTVQTLHRLYLCIPFVISHNFKEMNLIYTPRGFGQRTRFSLKLWPLSSLMSL